MHRVQVPPETLEQTPLLFPPEVCHYLYHVLRLRVGEDIGVFDGSGQEWRVRLSGLSARQCVGDKIALLAPVSTGMLPVILGQGIPKGSKLDVVVEKCAELGLSTLVPIETERTVTRPPQERLEARLARWQRLAEAAARQCGRRTLLEIHAPLSLAAFCAQYQQAPLKMVCWEEEHQRSLAATLAQATGQGPIVVLIGPEGGLASHEVACAQAYGFVPVSLGPWVLRTETAAIAITTIVRYSLGDFEP